MSPGDLFDGFITISRRMPNSWLWQLDPGDFKIAMTCLFMANFKDGKWHDGTSLIEVPRGSFISSYQKISDKAGSGLTAKKVRGTLGRLVTAEFIKMGTTSGKRYSFVTIVNYESYQDQSQKAGTPPGTGRAQDGHRTGTGRATIEQRNKGTREQTDLLSGFENPSDVGQEDMISETLRYLSAKNGVKVQVGAEGNRKNLRARLRSDESVTLEELKLLIDAKVADWTGTKYAEYLRPSTLFSEGKFPGYLKAARDSKPKQAKAYVPGGGDRIVGA